MKKMTNHQAKEHDCNADTSCNDSHSHAGQCDTGQCDIGQINTGDSRNTVDVPLEVVAGGQESEPIDELAALRGEVDHFKDKYLRALAELENYKKRVAKERSDLIRYAGEHLAVDMLEVIDTLEIALKQMEGRDEDIVKGVSLIHQQILAAFNKHSISSRVTMGKVFDPSIQAALAQVPTGDYAPGVVMEEFRKPYFFRDKLLRPGQVVVAVEMANDQANDKANDKANVQANVKTEGDSDGEGSLGTTGN